LLVALAEEFQVSTDFLLTGKAAACDSIDPQQLLIQRLEAAREKLRRRSGSLAEQELAVLLAAMLTEP
jgi:hypothetical protein